MEDNKNDEVDEEIGGSTYLPPTIFGRLTREGLLLYFTNFLGGESGMAAADELADLALLIQSDTFVQAEIEHRIRKNQAPGRKDSVQSPLLSEGQRAELRLIASQAMKDVIRPRVQAVITYELEAIERTLQLQKKLILELSARIEQSNSFA